ncbi:MAG: tetratricopeptide repeat protein [Planctomycetes bacterium]|nr:tetratricopeptide repeat protein [Planctomycetota bacterium]
MVVVPLAVLNGAERITGGGEEFALLGLDGVDLAFLSPPSALSGVAEPARFDPLTIGVTLFTRSEDERFVIVEREERECFVVVTTTSEAEPQFVVDDRGSLVGLARAAVDGRATVVTLAGALERALDARPLDWSALQATHFERDAGARRELAGWYAAGRHYSLALDHYLAAAELEPALAAEWVRPSTAVLELALREARLNEQLDAFLPALERAANRFDREPRVLHAYALALLDLGEPEAALRWFVDAASISGASDGPLIDSLRAAYLHAGEAARAQARPADAIALLEQALRRFREDPGLLLSLGYAYYEFGDRDRARIVLAKAASLDPRQAVALESLLASLAPPQGSAAGDAVEIRFQRGGGAVRATARFSDRLDASVIVDTGASITAISEGLADRLKIDRSRPLRTVTVTTASGRLDAPVVLLSSLDLHGAKVTNVEAVVLPLQDDGGGEALVGLNFLEHFHLSLDAARGILRLAAKR